MEKLLEKIKHNNIKYTIEFVKNIYDGLGFELLENVYSNNKSKLKTKCKKCNHIWNSKFNNITHNHGCPKCSISKKHQCQKFSLKFVKDFCKLKNLKFLSDYYAGAISKIKVQCLKCNNIWEAWFFNLRSGHGCRKCGLLKRKETFLKKYEVDEVAKNREIMLKAAKSSNKYIQLKHWFSSEEMWCRGSYEVNVINYLNKNQIDYNFQPQTFLMPDGHTYTPDLYLIDQNIWIEIKGYFWGDAEEKWDWFHKEYSNSELWDKRKLKELNIL